MGTTRPKTLTPVAGETSVLELLLREIGAVRRPFRVLLFVREWSADLQRVLSATTVDTQVVTDEPHGYFRDLVQTKRTYGLGAFAVLDSDLVVEPGAAARFLDEAFASDSWLFIGVSAMPERESGRPAWVDLDRDGYISALDRKRQARYRTVGAFRWSEQALADAGEPDQESSIMAYIADHLDAPGGVMSFLFEGAINVNTEADADAAREMYAALSRRAQVSEPRFSGITQVVR